MNNLHIAVVGLGKVGYIIPYYLEQLGLTKLTIYDVDPARVNKATELLSNSCQIETNLKENCYDLVILSTSYLATKSFIQANHEKLFKGVKLFISVSRADYQNIADYNKFNEFLTINKVLLLVGCGLEPGLTEILSKYLILKYKEYADLKIYCGGVPLAAKPPFYYNIYFGDKLPVQKRIAYYKKEGRLLKVQRFDQLENLFINNIGQVEAFSDGMLPFYAQSQLLNSISNFTQKTIRWGGFTNAINTLHQCGMFSNDIDARYKVSPNDFIHHMFEKNDLLKDSRDMVILNILLLNAKKEESVNFLLISKFEKKQSVITAMAKTTAFPAAFTAIICANKGCDSFGIKWAFEYYGFNDITSLISNLELFKIATISNSKSI